MSPWIALVTLLTVVLMSACTFAVGRARGRYKVAAPATTGHPDFERAFRAQMNTLEAALMFLPTLWVAGHYADPMWAAALGGLWLVGRAWYVVGYLAEARRRAAGFLIGMLAFALLLVQAGWGLAAELLASAGA